MRKESARLYACLDFTSALQVSWMRKRDMHILSAGTLMYTSDLRFLVIHPEKSENWTLQIKSPQERDSGVYECQVSTEPKMSLNYSLNVVDKQCTVYTERGSVTLDVGRSLGSSSCSYTRLREFRSARVIHLFDQFC
ncbi:hypothetical protein EAI_13196 [Harpegnathos saltator]|uniref:Ig-like domain-containing protein n=1 Tax=Harpegnathos saltator TaxID=610380 RepID=E2B975_HARSA|nr:hypothetical protein EAI_13196 [Harpegnathos saltator]